MKLQKFQGRGVKCLTGTEFLILNTTELYPLKVVKMKISLVVQWLRLLALTAGSVDSIPDWETKILHAVWCGQKKRLASSLKQHVY